MGKIILRKTLLFSFFQEVEKKGRKMEMVFYSLNLFSICKILHCLVKKNSTSAHYHSTTVPPPTAIHLQ